MYPKSLPRGVHAATRPLALWHRDNAAYFFISRTADGSRVALGINALGSFRSFGIGDPYLRTGDGQRAGPSSVCRQHHRRSSVGPPTDLPWGGRLASLPCGPKLNTEQIFMPMFRDEAARCAVEIVKTALANGSTKLRGNGPTASDTPKGVGEKDGLYLASLISTLTDHLEKL